MIHGMLTINDSYQIFHKTEPEKPFLSEFNVDWWKDYLDNHDIYDRDFVRKYFNFVYFLQNCPKTDAEKATVIADFRDAVTAHLMKNAEKYRQLWRITQVPDEKNELYENVNGTETTTTTYGKVTESDNAAREDTHDITSDPYTDIADTTTDAVQDVTTSVKGKRAENAEHKVAAYDTSAYAPESQDTTNADGYTDKDTADNGKRHGKTESAYAQTHTKNVDSFGAHKDKESNSGKDIVEFERRGNIGVMTVADMEEKQRNFWMQWEFYDYIFSQICADLLMIP